MADSNKPFHEVVAEKLIEQLKAGTAPWQRPWEPGEHLPMNPTTDERDEAEWIVGELRARSAKGDWTWPEMAILYRTNSQSRALAEAFRRAGIPYRIVGAISFYDRREVKDLLAYLRLVANPADDEAFLRAIAVPRRGLGESSLAILAEAALQWGKPLLSAAGAAEMVQGLRPNVRSALRDFATLIGELRERALTWPPAQVLEQVIQAVQYEQLLIAEGPEGPGNHPSTGHAIPPNSAERHR